MDVPGLELAFRDCDSAWAVGKLIPAIHVGIHAHNDTSRRWQISLRAVRAGARQIKERSWIRRAVRQRKILVRSFRP